MVITHFICSKVPATGKGCGTSDGATSLTEPKAFCRWTAIDIHSKMMAVAIGLVAPLGIAVPIISKYMTWPDPRSKLGQDVANGRKSFYNYLGALPTPLGLHVFLMLVAWSMIVSAVIIVAVGLDPENISKKQGERSMLIVIYSD